MPRKETGFTLIELVVVIVIIGILAAVALPRFMDMNDEAKIAATKGTLAAIRGGISLAHGKIQVADNDNTARWPTIEELRENQLGINESRSSDIETMQIYQTSEAGGTTDLPDVQLPTMYTVGVSPDAVVDQESSDAYPSSGDRNHGGGDSSSRWAYYPGDDSPPIASFWVYDGHSDNADGDGNLPYQW